MSASYVAGTAPGAGMAKNQRGPGNGRDHFVAKTNPHIVAAGVVTLASNTATIVLGNMPAATTFAIIATPNTASATIPVVVPTYTSAGTLTKFSITNTAGAGTDVISWAVISLGSGMTGIGTAQSSPTTSTTTTSGAGTALGDLT